MDDIRPHLCVQAPLSTMLLLLAAGLCTCFWVAARRRRPRAALSELVARCLVISTSAGL